MRRIRGTNTKPEMELKALLDGLGVAYAYQAKVGRWRVDFLIPDLRLIVEYRSCFWHWHQGCRRARLPKSNQDYWIPKLRKNAERDARKDAELAALGYRVFVVRDCDRRSRLAELERLLGGGAPPAPTAVGSRRPAEPAAAPSAEPAREEGAGGAGGSAEGRCAEVAARASRGTRPRAVRPVSPQPPSSPSARRLKG